ncbi:MAG: insulinase family protein, partial [Pseudomonadota bacterium]
HGNLTGKETLQRIAILQNTLLEDASAAHVKRIHMVQLPMQSRFVDKMELDHADSSISIYLQSDQRDRATRAQFALLRQLLSQPLYTELRTRRQLGYFVFTYSIDLIQVPSVVIALQSPDSSPAMLHQAVEEFLVDFEQQLLALDDSEFQRNVLAVISQVEEQDKQLRHRTNRYWGAITREDYRFDASPLFADALRGITRQQIAELYRQLFIDKENGRLVVYSAGHSQTHPSNALPEPFSAMTQVESIEQFKRDKTLLPPLSDVAGIE